MAETIDARWIRRRRRRCFLIIVGVAVLATIVGVALLMNIFERKQEARNPFYRVVELTDDTEDPAVWGKNFPLQYDDYKRTVDQVRTRFGGSEAEPRTPTKADPRSVVSQSRIEEDPRLKTMWAGYAFAKDFREERGHAYMLDDQTLTERQQVVKQPGTCIQCHGSVYVPYKKAGNGDLIKGFEKLNQMPFFEARKLVSHPVACIDCHDASTMQLRVTRPGFHRRHPRFQSHARRSELRRQQAGDAPGDARLCLRPVPRRISFQGTGKAAGLSVGQRAQGRRDSGLLRRGAVQRLDPCRYRRAACSKRNTRSSRCGVRASTRARRDLRRLPYALQTRRRAQDQRPPRAQPRCSTSTALARPATSGPRKSSRRGSKRFRSAPSSCAMWRWMR